MMSRKIEPKKPAAQPKRGGIKEVPKGMIKVKGYTRRVPKKGDPK